MKGKKVLAAVLAISLTIGGNALPKGMFGTGGMTAQAATGTNAGSGNKVTKLGTDVILYEDSYEESRQIPCEKLGGIYFLNGNQLTFYSLNTNQASPVYTFESDDYSTTDTFLAGNRLYMLEEYMGWPEIQSVITVYNLDEQRVERTLTLDIPGNAIGADASGRIYLSGYDTEREKYVLSLLSADGKVLSELLLDDNIEEFGAFDSSNGNFYFEGYYNWIYWGYDHAMHGLFIGNVSNNKITIGKEPALLISQAYWYDRQSPMDLLDNKYLCVDSTFNSVLYVLNSNKTKIDSADTSVYFKRDEQTDEFDHTASIGSRTVYLEKTGSIVTFADSSTLVEYKLADKSEMARANTAHPVFALMKYKDSILAIEKDGTDFYMETFTWKHATRVTVSAPASTVKIGKTLQLSAGTDGTLTEEFIWSSSNNKVASVTESGKVFGWSAGTATITVKTKQGLKATYKVTVRSGLPVKDPAKSSILTKGLKTYNISYNNYSVWGSVVNSYLMQNSDGTLSRVEYTGGKVLIETYSSNGATLKSTKKISAELELFGGFYSGSTYNFLVFGQMNLQDSDSKEVMRIVKYSKAWKRLGSVSVKGANTYFPFDAGSLRMTETGGKLYIYTCHEMYESDDGLHHQANMTYVVNESKMSVEQSYYDVMNIAQAGYVSHSFNQFIQTDGTYVYRVDHGDAYPRAISITRCEVNGDITNVIYTLPVDLSNTGYPGQNSTGASIGGFALSSSQCLIAGNAVDYTKSNATSYDVRNIFVSVTDKSLESSKVVWLTKYKASQNITVYTPQLVKIGDDQFLVMWEEYYENTDKVYTRMAAIDGNGNLTSDIAFSTMRLSDCQPIVCKDGLIRWYMTNSSAPTIYTVNPFHLDYGAGNAFIIFPTPKLTGVSNTADGMKITWGKVSGAAKYRVYYKTGSGSWTKLADTSSTSYTWKGTKNGTNYTFTVRCLSSNGKYFTSNYNKTGKTYKRLAQPKVSKFEVNNSGLKITWGKVTGASRYRVYYKKGTGWKQLRETAGTTCTINATLGKNYTYTVRAFYESNSSSYDAAGKAFKRLATPKLGSASNAAGGVKITWGKVSGAAKYRVYYKTGSGSWKKLADTTATSYTWKKAKKGTTYTFTVRCINSNASTFTSGYNTTGKKVKYNGK